MGPTCWSPHSFTLECRKRNMVHRMGGAVVVYTRWWCCRDLRPQVGLSLGSGLLQRYDHPGYHHRGEPDGTHVSQLLITCYAREGHLTQCFHYRRETDKDHQQKEIRPTSPSHAPVRLTPFRCSRLLAGKEVQRSAGVGLEHLCKQSYP